MRKTWLMIALAAALTGLPLAASAGGWAITTFDELPAQFESGSTYHLTYTVLQHGKTPLEGLDTGVVLRNTASGKEIRFDGAPTGVPGQYQVEITTPDGGSWEWWVVQGGFAPHELGPLPLSVPAAAVPTPQGASASAGSTDSLLRVLLPVATLAAAALTLIEANQLRAQRRGLSTQS
jgi:hypothetical protein